MVAPNLDWLGNQAIAHRGLHTKDCSIPENSMAAFRNAISQGYAIELDVIVGADQQVLVFHDYDTRRVCGTSRQTHTLSISDRKGLWLHNTKEQIPLLQDVLDLVRGQVPLLIEIKDKQPVRNAKMIILNALLRYSGPFAIQSFSPFILSWFAAKAPLIPRGQLASDFKDHPMPGLLRFVLKNMLLNRLSQPDFLAYDARAMPSAAVRRQLQKKKMPVLAWTIRDETERAAVGEYCDNIIFEYFDPVLSVPAS